MKAKINLELKDEETVCVDFKGSTMELFTLLCITFSENKELRDIAQLALELNKLVK